MNNNCVYVYTCHMNMKSDLLKHEPKYRSGTKIPASAPFRHIGIFTHSSVSYHIDTESCIYLIAISLKYMYCIVYVLRD